MGLSFWHLLLVLIVVFILFGACKLPKVMGDVGKGIRNLREGLKGEEDNLKSDEQKIAAKIEDKK